MNRIRQAMNDLFAFLAIIMLVNHGSFTSTVLIDSLLVSGGKTML